MLVKVCLHPSIWNLIGDTRVAFNVHYSTSESWNWKITLSAQLNTFTFFLLPRKDFYNLDPYPLSLFASCWIWYFTLWLVTNSYLEIGQQEALLQYNFVKFQAQNQVSFINTSKHFTENNGLENINWYLRLVYFYYICLVRRIIYTNKRETYNLTNILLCQSRNEHAN